MIKNENATLLKQWKLVASITLRLILSKSDKTLLNVIPLTCHEGVNTLPGNC